MSEGDYYTVSQAAKVLKVTTGRIRQMLGSGELVGEKDVNGRWRIGMWAYAAQFPRTLYVGNRLGSSLCLLVLCFWYGGG